MKKLFSIVGVIAIMGILLGAGFGSAADLKVQGGTIQAGADYDLKMYEIAEVCGWGLECNDGLVYFVRVSFTATPPVGGDNELTYCVNITDVNGNVIAKSQKAITFPVQSVSNYNLVCEKFDFDNPVKACAINDIHIYVEGSANSGPTNAVCP